jgi:hypothetical protein
MSADVIMLHKPGSVDLDRLRTDVALAMSQDFGKQMATTPEKVKHIADMIRKNLPLHVNDAEVTAGLYVGFRVIDGKTPKIVLRWRSYDNKTFWDSPVKFRSRRLARVWAKGKMRNCVPSSVTFRPVTPLTYITCEFLVTKPDTPTND